MTYKQKSGKAIPAEIQKVFEGAAKEFSVRLDHRRRVRRNRRLPYES